MNLKAYLANMNMTINDFSKILGCHPSYLSQVIHSKKVPSKEFMKLIVDMTGGKVKMRGILCKKPKKS